MKRLARIIAGFVFAASMAFGAEQRLWIDAKINGAPAKIFLDTGAGAFYLFRAGAERLGFDLPDATNKPWQMYWGDKCQFECGGFTGKIRPVITEPPANVKNDSDGFVGWKTIHNSIVRIDAEAGRAEFLDAVPAEARDWLKFYVRTRGSGILALEAPKHRGLIVIDSGSSLGIGIPKDQWRDWKSAHPDARLRVVTSEMPSVGRVQTEEAVSGEIAVAGLEVADVSVGEIDPWSARMVGDKPGARFGLGALKRVELVVDGKRGIAFMRAKGKEGKR